MADVRLRIVGECIIEVGERQVGPDSPNLFALLLYLALEGGRAVPRAELCELLFASVNSTTSATHSLRQLLYRLRKLGAPIVASGTAVNLRLPKEVHPLSRFEALGREFRSGLSAHDLTILPSYDPCGSRQLRDWLDTWRASLGARVRAQLLADFEVARRASEWEAAVRTGHLLAQIDGANLLVVSGVVEALLMLGRKRDALCEIDMLLAERAQEIATPHELRTLRARIERSTPEILVRQATFRGRQDTLTALRALWSQVCSGHSQLCIILGTPGIGKTRLASEFSTLVTLAGGQVLTYRCDGSDAHRPLSVFARLVPQLRTLRGSLGATPTLQPYLDLVSGPTSTSPALDPASLEATRADIALALVDLIDAVAAEKPLLLTIDDAHLLDPASSTVLKALASRQAMCPVMIVCYSRRLEAGGLSITSSGNVAVLRLTPLSEVDSRALLTELISCSRPNSLDTEWCLTQAAGNPFYLHALARHGAGCAGPTTLPFDIRALASSSYFALGDQSRALLEASLFLGRFATLRRVREVAQLDGGCLLSALRVLEDGGLLTFLEGELRPTHALLGEAIVPFIPRSVGAVLHEHVAHCLQADYDGSVPALPLAWAAAEHWMAAGDHAAAMKLLRLCAMQAAGVGEPRAAARTLLLIPRATLSPSDRSALLTEVCDYAEAAADFGLLTPSLQELLSVQQLRIHDRRVLDELEFRLIEAKFLSGTAPERWVETLSALVSDPVALPRLRIRAGVRLLVLADLQLDQDLASRTNRGLHPLLESLPHTDPLRQRAEVAYHTAFGDREYVVQLATRILAQNPEPSLASVVLRARKQAAFTLARLTRDTNASQALIQDYHFMRAHHVTTEATYRSIVLAEIAVADGVPGEAAEWLAEAREMLATESCPPASAGYLSTVACLAIAQRRFDEAEGYLDELRQYSPTIAAPRWGAVESAFRVRLRIARGENVEGSSEIALLRRIYAFGGHLGVQDYIVEALWHAEVARGQAASASALLSSYLFERRRELAPPEWPFRSSTAADPAWTRFPVMTSVTE